ncbi:MAG: hypothetical protein ACJ8FY_16695 [Gemmataceae bacterium]
MNSWTRFFLVLLRLTIGWHCLIEGLDKVESIRRGPTVSGPAWSSAAYLRESSGPLAPFFRWQAGDPDEEALQRFAVLPVEDTAKTSFRSRIPPALDKHFDDYFQRFVEFYKLDEEQTKRAEDALVHSKERAVRWLLGLDSEREREERFAGVGYKIKETSLQRINNYRDKLQELRKIQNDILSKFGKDVYKQKLTALKSEVAKMRNELVDDLDSIVQDDLSQVLSSEQRTKGVVPAAPPPALLVWTDRFVSYGLLFVGAGLLLGVFTRTACVGGAILLLMFYLAQPALPDLPALARSEGHYLYVNKNIIEMIALLALATTASGRWVGLDGLLRFLNPRNYGRETHPNEREASSRRSPIDN